MNIAMMFLGGDHQQSVTSVTLANNTAKTIDTIVPTGERWFLINVKVTNPDDVNRVFTCHIYKEAAKTNDVKNLLYVAALTASGGTSNWPNTNGNFGGTVEMWAPVVLSAGNTLSATWAAGGASAGGTDADGLVVEYLRIMYGVS